MGSDPATEYDYESIELELLCGPGLYDSAAEKSRTARIPENSHIDRKASVLHHSK